MRYVVFFLMIHVSGLLAQKRDSLFTDSISGKKVMRYDFGDKMVYYPKPKPFGFLWKVPRTFRDVAVESFSKKSLPAWGAIAGTTAIFLMFDQQMLDGVQQFSNYINLDNTRIYHDVLGFDLGSQHVTIYEAPGNLNTFIYQIGEGLPSLLLGAGLAIYGNVKNDYRARSTASQMVQTFVVMGVTTQLLKRVFGRESPYVATQDGGTWRPFPNWGTYQNNVPRYDAFPSGHMATLMATMVVLSDNYPEKRWIKPIGYSVMSLVGLAMMNNGVHWASDYPLAIGLGYVVGKVTVKMNRWVKGKPRM
jgi:hypothetical protein